MGSSPPTFAAEVDMERQLVVVEVEPAAVRVKLRHGVSGDHIIGS